MRKFVLIILLVSAIVICISCSDSTTSNNSGYGLPHEFPLQEGNAWIYERAYYENGLKDSTRLDTLYIAGRFEDYYLYTWNPEEYFVLVKNYENKLVAFGHINSDTTFYNLPSIWAFYGETGYIDSTYYANYSYTNIDSQYISILPDEQYFEEHYDTYKDEKYSIESHSYKSIHQYVNKMGFGYWELFDENNNLTETTEMIEMLEDFYPESILTNKNQKKSKHLKHKCNYSADGL